MMNKKTEKLKDKKAKGFTLIRALLHKNLVNVNAFTLIELLVVISVIGILAALLFARFGSVDKSGRDTKRKSDLNQYRIALENYATKTSGVYPSDALSSGNSSDNNGIFSSSGSLSSYLSASLDDPLNDITNGYAYYYKADADGLNWVLQGRLETETDSSWQVCSNGKSGKISGHTAPTSTCAVP